MSTHEITTGALRTRLESIARANEYAHVDTLLTRGSDRFDWAQMSIETLRSLMEAAFQAGLDAAHSEGITQVVKSGEEYSEADRQVIHPAPDTLPDADAAKQVGTNGQENTWMPVGNGKHVLVYTTWANVGGWRKVPAIYTTAPDGSYELASWYESGCDYNDMREGANAEAMLWALTTA